METIHEVIKAALSLGACDKPNNVKDWKGLARLFFSPQGREFCQVNNFPSHELFRGIAEGMRPHGVYVDAGKVEAVNPGKIGVIGDTEALITIDDNTRIHKVILMHGARVRIKASNFAVILIVNIGECELVMDKDKTVVVL